MGACYGQLTKRGMKMDATSSYDVQVNGRECQPTDIPNLYLNHETT